MPTAMEKSVAQLLVTSLDTVTPPVEESLAAPSRRRFNGWFLEIGITRRAIHKLNRMEGALRQGCKDKVRRLWKGLSEGQRTAMYPAVAPPVTDNAGQWRWWKRWLDRACGRIKKGLQGTMRKEHRKTISKHVKRREEAF